jgi:hypothetical protein
MAAEVGLEVLKAGARTEALFTEVAARLGFERLTPLADGYLPITFMSTDVGAAKVWWKVRDALDAADLEWSRLVRLLPLGVRPGQRVVIESVRNTGATDNGADDTLYVVEMRERDGPREGFLFSVARSQGKPSEDELRGLVEHRAASFATDRGVVASARGDLESIDTVFPRRGSCTRPASGTHSERSRSPCCSPRRSYVNRASADLSSTSSSKCRLPTATA